MNSETISRPIDKVAAIFKIKGYIFLKLIRYYNKKLLSISDMLMRQLLLWLLDHCGAIMVSGMKSLYLLRQRQASSSATYLITQYLDFLTLGLDILDIH